MAKSVYPKANDHTPAARAQRETYWRRLFDRWKASGLAKTEFCERENVTTAAFHWWIKDLERRDRKAPRVRTQKPKAPAKKTFPKLVPVQVAKPAVTRDQGVELVVAGQVIRVAPGFHPDTLRRVVAVLEGRLC